MVKFQVDIVDLTENEISEFDNFFNESEGMEGVPLCELTNALKKETTWNEEKRKRFIHWFLIKGIIADTIIPDTEGHF